MNLTAILELLQLWIAWSQALLAFIHPEGNFSQTRILCWAHQSKCEIEYWCFQLLGLSKFASPMSHRRQLLENLMQPYTGVNRERGRRGIQEQEGGKWGQLPGGVKAWKPLASWGGQEEWRKNPTKTTPTKATHSNTCCVCAEKSFRTIFLRIGERQGWIQSTPSRLVSKGNYKLQENHKISQERKGCYSIYSIRQT